MKRVSQEKSVRRGGWERRRNHAEERICSNRTERSRPCEWPFNSRKKLMRETVRGDVSGFLVEEEVRGGRRGPSGFYVCGAMLRQILLNEPTVEV